MEWWKVIIGPIIVATVVGVGAFFVGRLTAPDTANIEAEIRWLDIANPVQGLLTFPVEAVDKMLQTNFKMSGAAAAISKFRFHPTIRIAVLVLRNNTSVRSKDVEVAGADDTTLLSQYATPAQTEYVSKMKVKAIDPGSKAVVYIVSPPWSPYTTDPVRVLYDDRKVEVKSLDVPDEFQGIVRLVSSNVPLSAVIAVAAALSLLTFLLILPLSFAMSRSLELRARFTNQKEALKLKAFLDFLTQNHPEKLSQPNQPSSA
jgi:hypothetical protein